MTLPSAELVDATAAELVELVPPGKAFEYEAGKAYGGVFAAFAEEFAKVKARAEDLLRESDPRLTLELLDAWERAYGLPSACTGPLSTVEERRAAIVAKIVGRAGPSRQALVELAATLGYTIRIVEHRPFLVGSSRIGDPLTNHEKPFLVGLSRIGDRLAHFDEWAFTVDVVAPLTTVRPFLVGSSVIGERLAVWQNTLLECTLRLVAPAHIRLRFIYEVNVAPPVLAVPATVLSPLLVTYFDFEAFDLLNANLVTLTQEFDETGGRWQLAAGSTAAVELPSAFVTSELVRNGGLLAWHFSGTYINTTGATVDVILELFRDAQLTPFASFPMVGLGHVVSGSGQFWIDVAMSIRNTGQARMHYRAIFNPGVVADGTAGSGQQTPTIREDINRIWGTLDFSADQRLVPKLRKAAASNATLAVLEATCVAPVIRSGAGAEG